MKKTAAIICEFNPFHTGHRYLIEKIRTELGFDRIVCFMSGNFVQRGEPAVMDKYVRAADALQSGTDLVLELPAPFSTGSAGYFAHAAVSMILQSGICTHLIFGLEPGISLKELKKIADTPVDQAALRRLIKEGFRYSDALSKLTGRQSLGSNALLAVSYLEALNDLDPGRRIIPLSIERIGDPYGIQSPDNPGFTSATALRRLMYDSCDAASSYLPFEHKNTPLCFPDQLSMLLNEKLLINPDFSDYWDVPDSLSEHLKDTRFQPLSFTERIDDSLSSCYSRSRISRALLHILLNIRQEDINRRISEGYVSYFRVLAYRVSSGLLHDMKSVAALPVYTKNARFYEKEPDALYYDQIWHILTKTCSDHLITPYVIKH